jgi:mono/diheme cytochrome c family protein
VAWDPVARQAAWRIDRSGPWNGGTLATAGGLVFQGTIDGRFQALDARTGEVRWEHDNGVPSLSGPMSYAIDGEQFVTVLGGFGTALYLVAPALAPLPGARINGRVYTFRLGGTAAAPPVERPVTPVPAPPAISVSAAELAAGADLYGRLCAMCHGAGAIAGAVPDLRTSAALQTADAWRDMVLGGERIPLGMPNFDESLTPETLELVRAYVARQAEIAYRAERR